MICISCVKSENGFNCYEAKDCDRFDIKHGNICCPSIDNDNGVIVCDEDNFEGNCKFYSMYGKSCLNLDENDTTSSINTLGKCYRIFEHINCAGISHPILPGSPSHNSTAALNMNNIITSIGLCNKNDYGVKSFRVKRSTNDNRGFAKELRNW